MGDRAGEDSIKTRGQIIGARKRSSSEEECAVCKVHAYFCKHPSMVVTHM